MKAFEPTEMQHACFDSAQGSYAEFGELEFVANNAGAVSIHDYANESLSMIETLKRCLL